MLSAMLHTGTGTLSTWDPEARGLLQIWGRGGLHNEFYQNQELLESEILFRKKKKWKELAHIPSHYCIHERSQKKTEESRTGTQTGTKTRTMGEWCLLVCFPWLAQSALLYNSGLPTLGTTMESSLGYSTQILNQENDTHTCPPANLLGTVP